MKFHYAGKFNGNEEELPKRNHPINYVPFKEPDQKKLSVIVSIISLILIVLFFMPFIFLTKRSVDANPYLLILGLCGPILTLLPHELLHALWFQQDVYLYTAIDKGMLFVVGTEDMSKTRFILMSLCPNIIFGLIPYLIYLFHTDMLWIGVFGATCISMGAGDYLNVFNAITQVPNHAKVYMNGFHSYYYLP